ncbi:MAG TPA: hypothetical protein VIY73_21960, partial [Polyangiaceae bacterium]
MSWQENQIHRQVDARIAASDRARSATASTRTDWRSSRWGCRGCGKARPLGGFDPSTDLGTVMAISISRDGACWGRDGDGMIVFCGPNCIGQAERDVERRVAPPFERVSVQPAAGAP